MVANERRKYVVPAVSPVRVVVNVPAPEPVVTVYVDDPAVVPYTIPLTVTCVIPSSVTFPPTTADVVLIEEAGVLVVTTGIVVGERTIERTALTYPPDALFAKSVIAPPERKFCILAEEALDSVEVQK